MGMLDVDLAYYTRQIEDWSREELYKEATRLMTARDGWKKVINQFGTGHLMVMTADAMLEIVLEKLGG